MKFVHAADLHLDSPMRNLSRYEGAPAEAIRGATRRALANLVDLCIAEEASFLLLAGDLYDGNWKDYNTGLFFAAEMSRLRAASIDVVFVRGNHDAMSQITRNLRLPGNVHELSVHAVESFELPSLSVVIHGQGFASRAVTDDLAAQYPRAVPGALNIGLLHTSVDGREGHETYAPCRLETLKSKGYAYWALGHVHAREVLCEEPWIVFPGNLQGRHAKETGPKGATLVTVQGDRIASVEHRALDVVRWCTVVVDAAPATTGHDVVDLARAALEQSREGGEGRAIAARVIVTGTTEAHGALASDRERYTNEIRAAANDIGQEGIWVERVEIHTRSTIDLEGLRTRDDAIGQLARSLHALRTEPEATAELARDLADLRQKLPLEAREGPGGIRLDTRELAEVLADVEEMLLPRLLAKELGP